MFATISTAALAFLLPISTVVNAAPANVAPRLLRRTALPVSETDVSTSIAASSFYSSVTKVKSSPAAAARRRTRGYHVAALRDLEVEEEWAVQVKFGQEEVLLILDTGSSDTWVVQNGFQCVNATLAAEPEANCAFGPVYNGTFTEGEISNVGNATQLAVSSSLHVL